MRGALLSALLVAGVVLACGKPPREALQLDGNRLTVENGTSQEWRDVDIRLNTHFRVLVPSIEPGGRFQVPLDAFVAGYGQRFNFSRMQIRDLRMTAKKPDGATFELVKDFQGSGLAGYLPGKR